MFAPQSKYKDPGTFPLELFDSVGAAAVISATTCLLLFSAPRFRGNVASKLC